MTDRLIVTCEHGGNRVPRRCAALFAGHEAALLGHRAYDPGALELARQLARRLAAPLVASTTTRLLVDLNRSVGHRRLFSEFSRPLDLRAKQAILGTLYEAHRRRVERLVEERIGPAGPVLHIAVHSFTPVLHGRVRLADVGLLYAPARRLETRFCRRWQVAILDLAPELRVRRNYPYRGAADGLTTSLRRRFRPSQYLGIELEVNQRWPLGDRAAWRRLRRLLVESLAAAGRQTGLLPAAAAP